MDIWLLKYLSVYVIHTVHIETTHILPFQEDDLAQFIIQTLGRPWILSVVCTEIIPQI